MSELSPFALRKALTAMVAERKRLERRMESVSEAQEYEEGLTDQILDLQRAIDEVAAAYEAQAEGEPGVMSLEALLYRLESAD